MAVLLSPVAWIHHPGLVRGGPRCAGGAGRDPVRCGFAAGVWVYFILSIPWWGVSLRALDIPVHQPRFSGASFRMPLGWAPSSWYGCSARGCHGDGRVPPHSRRRPLLSVRCWLPCFVNSGSRLRLLGLVTGSLALLRAHRAWTTAWTLLARQATGGIRDLKAIRDVAVYRYGTP